MSNRIARFALPVASLASLATLASSQEVHVVDDSGGPGVDFTTLTDAVAAAQDGDVVLVKSGSYAEDVTVDGKSLVVTADAGANVSYTGRFVVQGLAAGQAFLWSDFQVKPPSGTFFGALDVVSCDGPVWVDGVDFSAPDLQIVGYMTQVQASGPVIFTDCTVAGGTTPAPSSNPGLRAIDSEVYLYHTSLTGGAGYGGLGGPFDGGAGVELNGGSLFALGGTIAGGTGTPIGSPFGCTGTSGGGGVGLVLSGAAPAADLYGTALVGGAPGALLGSGACVEGPDGAPFDVESGTLSEQAWSTPIFAVDSPVRSGQPVGVSLSGEPNSLAWLAFSTSPAVLPVAGAVGPLVVGAPAIFGVGSLGPDGQLALQVPTFVPPGFEGLLYASQALFVDPLGGATLSAPAPVVELDAAF
ncbi:MAG: hypothetical protein AAF682_13195 [Planctomycetota bacterium]